MKQLLTPSGKGDFYETASRSKCNLLWHIFNKISSVPVDEDGPCLVFGNVGGVPSALHRPLVIAAAVGIGVGVGGYVAVEEEARVEREARLVRVAVRQHRVVTLQEGKNIPMTPRLLNRDKRLGHQAKKMLSQRKDIQKYSKLSSLWPYLCGSLKKSLQKTDQIRSESPNGRRSE